MPARASFSDVDATEVAPLVAMMDATDAWDAVAAARSWVLEQLVPQPGLPTVDVGCGPGTFGRLARRRGHRVIDVDRSLAMLQECVSRSGRRGLVADASHLPLPDRSAALVHCERMLQWTEDPAAAMSELWRVIAADGHLAVTDTDWSSFTVDAPEPWMAEALAGAALGWVPHPRFAATLPDLLDDLGAARVEVRMDRVELGAWDPDDPAQADGPPGLPLHSIAVGAAGPERDRAVDAVGAVADAARVGRFHAGLTLVTATARR